MSSHFAAQYQRAAASDLIPFSPELLSKPEEFFHRVLPDGSWAPTVEGLGVFGELLTGRNPRTGLYAPGDSYLGDRPVYVGYQRPYQDPNGIFKPNASDSVSIFSGLGNVLAAPVAAKESPSPTTTPQPVFTLPQTVPNAAQSTSLYFGGAPLKPNGGIGSMSLNVDRVPEVSPSLSANAAQNAAPSAAPTAQPLPPLRVVADRMDQWQKYIPWLMLLLAVVGLYLSVRRRNRA